jgi:hypothetical protein
MTISMTNTERLTLAEMREFVEANSKMRFSVALRSRTAATRPAAAQMYVARNKNKGDHFA